MNPDISIILNGKLLFNPPSPLILWYSNLRQVETVFKPFLFPRVYYLFCQRVMSYEFLWVKVNKSWIRWAPFATQSILAALSTCRLFFGYLLHNKRLQASCFLLEIYSFIKMWFTPNNRTSGSQVFGFRNRKQGSWFWQFKSILSP